MRDSNLAEGAEVLLSHLLALEELALSGDVAAVAFGGDVLPHCAHCLSGDDLAADGPLYRYLELMARDFVFEADANLSRPHHGAVPVEERR